MSLSGLAIEMMVASLQEGRNSPVSQILLKYLTKYWREASGRCYKKCIWSDPGAVSWDLPSAVLSSYNEKEWLYWSVFLY